MKYRVIVTRDVTESAAVVVEASCDDEAENLALSIIEAGDGTHVWEIDDGSLDNEDPYITDVTKEN